MIFTATPIFGAWIIEPKRIEDHRGFFTRIWCRNELQQQGLRADIVQSNLGFSHLRGTLRGLHFQSTPHAEVKIVRCTRGAIFDVVVDLRPNSPSFMKWHGLELTEVNQKALYVPEGCAQGYLTLEDETEMYYHTSESYHPECASGVRYNDQAFGIQWPIPVTVISDQDRTWPDFVDRNRNISFESKGRATS